MNGDFAEPPESLAKGEVAARLGDSSASAAERIAPLFHALLGRSPTANEAKGFVGTSEESPTNRALLREAYWALLNSTEFLCRR